MAQFFFLSVCLNVIAGLTLAGDYLGEKIKFLASFKNIRASRAAQTAVAVAAAAVGLIKLIVLSPGEHVPVVGDLLPALTGILLGGIMLVEAYRPHVEGRSEQLEKLSKTILTYRVPVGIAGVVIGLVHFLFPGAVIL
jgi:hypothetical protein